MSRQVADLANFPEPADRPGSANRWAVRLAIAVIAGTALAGGLSLRNWMWLHSSPIHAAKVVQPDLSQELANWIGTAQSGQWSILATPITPPNFSADLILQINTIAEGCAAAIVFLIVYYWIRRGHLARPRLRITPSSSSAVPTRIEPDDRIAPPPDQAHWWGLAAALLVWFNPSALIDGHVALNTNVWIIPLYLAAMFAASIDWWFVAGMALSLAAAINGLVLLVAPVFVAWALIQGRPAAALRCVLGFAAIIVVLALPQLVPNRDAWIWWLCLVAAASAFAPFGYPNPGIVWLMLAVATMGVLNWQWLDRDHVTEMYMSLTLSAALLIGPWWLSKRAAPFWVVFLAMLGALVAAKRFGGNSDLLRLHLPTIAAGHAANLPAVLFPVLGWKGDSAVIFHAWIDVTPRIFFGVVCGFAMLLCAIGAAIHHHRDDPKVLLALVVPWVMLFALDPRMNDSTMAIAAVVVMVSLAASTGITLIGILTATLSAMLIAFPMLQKNPNFTPHWFHFIQGMEPSIGWMVALIAAVYLFQAIAPGARPPIVKVVPAFVRAARGR